MFKCERCGHKEEGTRGQWCPACGLQDGLQPVEPRGYELVHGNAKPLAEGDLGQIRHRSDCLYSDDESQAYEDIRALLQHIDALQARLDALENQTVDWMGDEAG